ncbi:MAG TPA: nuclear transport factor 2 family protein [Acidimicrobiales bacterium]|jgi:hypothetical protein
MTDFSSPLDAVEAVIADYFTAVTAQDVSLLENLFTPDAVLESGATYLEGRDEVLNYYISNTFTFPDFQPTPGPLTIEDDGRRVSVDIEVRLGGHTSRVHDVFELVDGRIRRITITGFDDALRTADRSAPES